MSSFHVTFDLLLIILSLLLLIINLSFEKILPLKGQIKEMENSKKATLLEENIV